MENNTGVYYNYIRKNGLSETLFGFVKTNLRKMFRLESVIHLMLNHGEVDSLMAYCSD